MPFGQIERAARLDEMGHHPGPAADVGQPVDRAPGDEHAIERRGLRNRRRRIVQVRLDEARPPGEPELGRQRARGRDRGLREVEAHHVRAQLRERQAAAAEVALQMEHAQPLDRPELGRLDRVQPAAPGAQRIELIARRAQMDRDPLVPVGAIGGPPRLVRRAHRLRSPLPARAIDAARHPY